MSAVYQISLKDGSIIKRFESMSDVMDELQIGRTAIYDAVNGITKTAGGYAWCKVEDYPNFNLKDHIDNKYRKIECVERKLQFNTIKEACDWVYENKYTTSKQINANICRACKKEIKAYGFHWRYV